MKILLSSQIKEADNYTIGHEPISSLDLMERASQAFTKWFVGKFDSSNRIVVFAGPGNNGGDALAVARMLMEKGYQVQVNILRSGTTGSPDFRANLERIGNNNVINEVSHKDQLPEIRSTDIVIDGLFGSGLSRPVEGIFSLAIQHINNIKPTIVAIDIASGLFSDIRSEGENIIKADYTISFQVPKLAFFMRQNFPFVGEWHVVDIGLNARYIDGLHSNYFTIEKNLVVTFLPRRKKFSHKGNFGRTILIAGSRGKLGAAILSSRACLRGGVGLLTVHIPEYGYQIMQMSVPEAMVTIDPSVGCFSELPDIDQFDSLGIGPGLGTNDKTIHAFEELLNKIDYPIVIDADGLNILSMHKELIKKVPKNSILTPHPKEFERLAGATNDDFERLEVQRQFAIQHQLYIIVKGAHSSVATPEGKIYFNTTGNPGMATAGSGDVLTGIVTALLAQTKDPYKASIAAVYLHGMAGDLAVEEKGEVALIASDIIEFLPKAFQKIKE